MRGARMAGNFGLRAMRKSHVVTAVAGRKNARKIRRLKPQEARAASMASCAQVSKSDSGFAYIGSNKLPLAVNERDFGRRRSDIHSAEKSILAHRPFFSASCSMKASMLVRACSSE